MNISYTPGVKRLVYILKTLGSQIGILSDGFTRIIDHIKQSFEVDYAFANTLEVKNGELTGRILGEILDSHQKMCYPSGSCSQRKCSSRTSYCSR